jgi:hypothetical protein
MKMKRIVFGLLAGVMCMFSVNVIAQDTDITEEELTRYAVAMDSIDVMKANVNVVINAMIKDTENITGSRYLEVSKAINNEEKLASINATEEEIAFVKSVEEKKSEMTAEINATFQTLAKDYIGDGGRVYKKVRDGLKNPEIKSQYDEILAKVKSAREEENGDEDRASAN